MLKDASASIEIAPVINSPAIPRTIHKTFTRTINADEFTKTLGQLNKRDIATGSINFSTPIGPGTMKSQHSKFSIAHPLGHLLNKSNQGSGNDLSKISTQNKLNNLETINENLLVDDENELLLWDEHDRTEDDESMPYDDTISHSILLYYYNYMQRPVNLLSDRFHTMRRRFQGLINTWAGKLFNSMLSRLGYEAVSC